MAGIDAVSLNVVTELWLGYRVGEYSGTRGFGPDDAGAVVGLHLRAGSTDAESQASGRSIQLTTGIAGSTQPSPTTT